MAVLSSLVKDTAIYGLSSIVGRFLGYLLVPLYTATFTVESGGYGVVTNMYAYAGIIYILLTYGMETGFFRFANSKEEDPMKVYSTILIAVGATSLLFIASCFLFITPISSFLGYQAHPEYIELMVLVMALDAFLAVPFAFLRFKKRPVKFMAIKFLFIIPNILLNLFFLVWCPKINVNDPQLISWFYDPNFGVGYVFLANFLSTACTLFAFRKELTGFAYRFDQPLFKKILRYSFPILLLGLIGIFNQTLDKIMFPFLFENKEEALVNLGIYGAAAKIAMVMAMFIQAFRYAYEPFVFGKNREGDHRQTYANAMKYFIIFGLLAFLTVMFYIDLFKYFIGKSYWGGLRVVPIVMLAELFMGIYFNLSFWYKLIDQTKWGAYFSFVGCVLMVAINLLFVPSYGYIACAWGGLISYLVITILSYFVGQKRNPIPYDLRSIGRYFLLAAILYGVGLGVEESVSWLKVIVRTGLLALFVVYVVKNDFPLSRIPIVNRYVK